MWLDNLPVAVLEEGTSGTDIYYVHPDHLGAPKVITDGSGATVWSRDHDAFGNEAPVGSFTYNLRYPGQYYDEETGLSQNYHRNYDPAIGRYMRRAPACTYAMILENASDISVKIGWAFDYVQRQRLFNQPAMPELGGLFYKTFLYEPWETAKEAFKMEQTLLKEFDEKRHPQNREIIYGVSQDQIMKAWENYIFRTIQK